VAGARDVSVGNTVGIPGEGVGDGLSDGCGVNVHVAESGGAEGLAGLTGVGTPPPEG